MSSYLRFDSELTYTVGQDVNLRDVLQRRLSSVDVCTSFLAAVEIVSVFFSLQSLNLAIHFLFDDKL